MPRSTPVEDLNPHDWNFETVPDAELVGCCYWEFARESAFIRDVRRRCLENWRAGGKWDLALHTDTQKLESIEYRAEVFLRGFFFEPGEAYQSANPNAPHYRHPDAPPITGSFPSPWQSLSEPERQTRARIQTDVDQLQIVPIKLSHWAWAKEIARECQRATDERHEQRLAWEKRYLKRDKKGHLDQLPEAPAAPEFKELRPGTRWGVGETLLVDIAWNCFTNDEITNYFRKWVQRARPKEIPVPDDKGRNKLRDWRVALERLGIMRLLHHCRLRDIAGNCPEGWRIYGRREWYKERKRAGEMFHRLFPFLPRSERPLNWETKGGRSR